MCRKWTFYFRPDFKEKSWVHFVAILESPQKMHGIFEASIFVFLFFCTANYKKNCTFPSPPLLCAGHLRLQQLIAPAPVSCSSFYSFTRNPHSFTLSQAFSLLSTPPLPSVSSATAASSLLLLLDGARRAAPGALLPPPSLLPLSATSPSLPFLTWEVFTPGATQGKAQVAEPGGGSRIARDSLSECLLLCGQPPTTPRGHPRLQKLQLQ